MAIGLLPHVIRVPRLARLLGDQERHDLAAQEPLPRGRILTDNPTVLASLKHRVGSTAGHKPATRNRTTASLANELV